MIVSSRARLGGGTNRLTEAVAARRAAGLPLLDLTQSNPTRLGLVPEASLAMPSAQLYSPEPCGLLTAREAVVAYYADLGAAVHAEQLVLCASTSEAYSWLFTLLAGPGERVLVPQPSYPLFAALAQLAAVELAPYPLHDPIAAVRSGLEGGAVAVVVVHPNNPTGDYVNTTHREALSTLVRQHGAALIADEVFYDFAAEGTARPPSHAHASTCLTFTLSGLSKVAGLPGFKLGWVVCSGPAWAGARDALEFIGDTFLSVGAPVQAALPRLLAERHVFQDRVRVRMAQNLQLLGARARRPGGGWTACLPLTASADDETTALALLDAGVLVHPGYFFDVDTPTIVVSLLTPPDVLLAALPALDRACEASGA